MLGYKDKTFCPMYAQCVHGEGCSRAATPKLREEAEAFGLGIYLYSSEPDCYEKKNYKEGKDESNG